MRPFTDPDTYRKSLGFNPELSHADLAMMRDAAADLMGAVRHLVSVLAVNAHEDPEIVAAVRRALVALGKAGANTAQGVGREEWEACRRISAMAPTSTGAAT